ncbi:hypothetical protein SISNIDRAFT_479733 [Sistotremastrum niveocremeum HHB9708]|uniref:SET domain-containing protein n=1 Tax=Sistotremastrum niveocremeum HHB9708 TaxID=1314777 RepID=A0A164QBM9_9AGAM|nr:hypothetical protein SISNIDRAFT_479733 [Sistotremastrum niveocremeum HHB9708]
MKIPGKGMGAVATRDIKQGELILRENPLFTLPLKIDGDPEELVLAALSILSFNARSQFINLSHHSHSKYDPNTDDELGIDGPTALSILQTNAISARPGNLGIFPQIARLNHGCGGAFNAVYNFRPPIPKPEAETSTDEEQEPEDVGFMVLHALKPIPANTELLTTYFTSRLPRSQRRDYLLQHYHFACDCALCSLPEAEVKESDARMEEIEELRKKLGLWATEGEGGIEGDEAIRVINKYWAVSEAEAYWSERGQMASDAAHVAAAHSDRLATTAWAGLASIWYGYELGADSDPAQAMGYFAYNPEGHFAWGTRKELTVGSPSPWILAGL